MELGKHIILSNQALNGWEYGMLRAFENTIKNMLGAEILNYPKSKVPPAILKKMQHGTNKAKYRSLLPKTSFFIQGDVLWVILMGPENFELDLYKGWKNKVKKKVVYLYDTLPMQMGTIKKLFSNADFDLCITSFEDAIPSLEKATNRKWHSLAQAAPGDIFNSPPFEERLIHFSSYGRRFPVFHETLKKFCISNGLYYDYTTHDAKHPTADAVELYRQYGWHVSHSLFNICWPVELTSPQRAGNLRPITARWFEAGLGGCIILGKEPDNVNFRRYFNENIVERIDPFQSKEEIFKRLTVIWENRKALFEKSSKFRQANVKNWGWEDRVEKILDLLKEDAVTSP